MATSGEQIRAYTGQPLSASRSIQLIYLAALIAAFTRMPAAMGLTPAPMLHIAVAAWVASSGGFVVVLPPALTRPGP
ncbi:MAG: NnrS family protein [Hyphomicrobiaceae bacterium]